MPAELRIDLAQALAQTHREIVVALWLSGGMLLATGMVAAAALRWRKTGLVLGGAYAATLCFIPVGHAQVLGPFGLAFAAGGLIWHDRVH